MSELIFDLRMPIADWLIDPAGTVVLLFIVAVLIWSAPGQSKKELRAGVADLRFKKGDWRG